MFKYFIIIVIVIIVIGIFALYNGFIRANNKVKEAFATMDVYLKKRWDLIPNLVETVKGYAKHEKETLEEIVNLRNNNYESMSLDEKINANKDISNSLSKLIALSENYPELKSSENFNLLSKELVKIEEDIANSRKYYNAVVRIFNNKVEMFPGNIIAKILGYKSKSMFEINSDERETVKVDL